MSTQKDTRATHLVDLQACRHTLQTPHQDTPSLARPAGDTFAAAADGACRVVVPWRRTWVFP